MLTDLKINITKTRTDIPNNIHSLATNHFDRKPAMGGIPAMFAIKKTNRVFSVVATSVSFIVFLLDFFRITATVRTVVQ